MVLRRGGGREPLAWYPSRRSTSLVTITRCPPTVNVCTANGLWMDLGTARAVGAATSKFIRHSGQRILIRRGEIVWTSRCQVPRTRESIGKVTLPNSRRRPGYIGHACVDFLCVPNFSIGDPTWRFHVRSSNWIWVHDANHYVFGLNEFIFIIFFLHYSILEDVPVIGHACVDFSCDLSTDANQYVFGLNKFFYWFHITSISWTFILNDGSIYLLHFVEGLFIWLKWIFLLISGCKPCNTVWCTEKSRQRLDFCSISMLFLNLFVKTERIFPKITINQSVSLQIHWY